MAEEEEGFFESDTPGRTPIHRANIRHIQAVGALRSALNPRFALERAFYAAEDLRQHLNHYDASNPQSVESLRQLREGADLTRRQYLKSRPLAAMGSVIGFAQNIHSMIGLPISGNPMQMIAQAMQLKNEDAQISAQTAGLTGQAGGGKGLHRMSGFDALIDGAAKLGRSKPEVMQFMQDITMATGKMDAALTAATGKIITLSRAYGLSEGQVTAATALGMSYGEDPSRLMAMGMVKAGSVAGQQALIGGANALGQSQLAMFSAPTIERNMSLVSSVMGATNTFNKSPAGIGAATSFAAQIPGLAMGGGFGDVMLSRAATAGGYGSGFTGMEALRRDLYRQDPKALGRVFQQFRKLDPHMRDVWQRSNPGLIAGMNIVLEDAEREGKGGAEGIERNLLSGGAALTDEQRRHLKIELERQDVAAESNTEKLAKIRADQIKDVLNDPYLDKFHNGALTAADKAGVAGIVGLGTLLAAGKGGIGAWSAYDRYKEMKNISTAAKAAAGGAARTAKNPFIHPGFGSGPAKAASRGVLGRISSGGAKFFGKIGGPLSGAVGFGLEYMQARDEGASMEEAGMDAGFVGGASVLGGVLGIPLGPLGVVGLSAAFGWGASKLASWRRRNSASAHPATGAVDMSAHANNVSAMAQSAAGGDLQNGNIAVLNITAGTVNLEDKNRTALSTAVGDRTARTTPFDVSSYFGSSGAPQPGQSWNDPRDGGTRPHEGHDTGGRKGRNLGAHIPGKVIMAENRGGATGNAVVIENVLASGQRVREERFHLQKIGVKAGDRVNADSYIGTAGDTGKGTTQGSGVDHHGFQVYRNGKWENIDPRSPEAQMMIAELRGIRRAAEATAQSGGIVATQRVK